MYSDQQDEGASAPAQYVRGTTKLRGASETDEHPLRPWRKVAEAFSEQSGEPMTPLAARLAHDRAIRKLRKLLAQVH